MTHLRRWAVMGGLIAALLTMAACQPKPQQSATNRFALTGEVVSVDTKAKVVTIKHQKIEGFMEAMTMEFPVKEAADLEKLKPGLAITATVFQEPQNFDYWVGEVKPQVSPNEANHPQ